MTPKPNTTIEEIADILCVKLDHLGFNLDEKQSLSLAKTIENFISQALQQQREEVIEEVREILPWKVQNVSSQEVGWNQYRNRMKELLKSLSNKKNR